MILRLQIILLVMSYERKNIVFYKKNLRLTKKILLIVFFVIEFFLTIASYQFFEKCLDFYKSRFNFLWNTYSTTLLF